MKEIQQWTEVTSRGGRERPKFGKRLVERHSGHRRGMRLGCGVLIGAESTQHTCAFFTFGH